MMPWRRGRGAGAEAVTGRYARVLDGETLWLAVEGGPPTVSLRYAGGELVEPTEPTMPTGPAGTGLVSARVPLAPLADVVAERLEVEVLAGDGRHATPIAWTDRPAPGPVRAAIPSRDRRWRWRVAAPEGRLVLVRAPVEPGATVQRLVVHDDGRGVRVETAPPHPPLDVRAEDHDLAPGAHARLAVTGLPLVRAHDDLKRPHFAVVLPTLSDGLRLRWLPDGRLAVSRDQP